MEVYIINSLDDFNNYFHLLRKDANIHFKNKMVGFDIEYIAEANFSKSFQNATTWIPTISNGIATCLIQVASENVCLIINLVQLVQNSPNDSLALTECGLPKQLVKMITCSSWIKLGVGVDHDLKLLSQNYNLGHCSGGIDLKNIAQIANVSTPNLEYLYNTLYNENIKKSCSVCDWSHPLTKKQISYASMDAIMSYKIGTTILQPCISILSDACTKTVPSSTSIDAPIKIITSGVIHNIKTNTPNYIGSLNEYAQKNDIPFPKYESVQLVHGHMSEFEIKCIFCDHTTAGTGRSKKVAKKIASKTMYDYIN